MRGRDKESKNVRARNIEFSIDREINIKMKTRITMIKLIME